jgi:2-dehydro-3-deoxyphosphogluconate aldolase / (4S)-4-hydroxy-2-oxoglutarate aldolase
VKVFPASSAGGASHVRALRSVFPTVSFCPTGGIAPEQVDEYLAAGARFVGMGGALVDERRVDAGDRAGVVAAAVRAMGQARA